MKKAIVSILVAMVSQAAFAGELYCGANSEKVKGSGVYDNLLYWEKVENNQGTTNFLLADGTLLRQKDFTPDTLAKVQNGDLGLGVNITPEGKTNLFTAKVERDPKGQITFKSVSAAMAFDGRGVMLMANGVSLICKEM